VKEIERLKRQVIVLGAEAEDAVRMAVQAAESRDEKLCEVVIRRARRTDDMEVSIEEECLKVLALHQPVAVDLRYIVAVLKINQDLERIGDLAAHIAERGIHLCHAPDPGQPFGLSDMAAKVERMLKKALDAFVTLDAASAREVCAADGEVDVCNRQISRQVRSLIERDPAHVEALLHIMHIARHLERIGDHATNISEDLIYLAEGRIVRHLRPSEAPRDVTNPAPPARPAAT
jgi:phosphate transport system protein